MSHVSTKLFLVAGQPHASQGSKGRPPLDFNPEQVVAQAKMGSSVVADFVQSNCIHRFNDINQLATCLSLFSDVAMFIEPTFRSSVVIYLLS